MLRGNGIGDTDKTCFTKEDQYKFKYGSEGLNTSDIKEYIRNPHKFNLKPEMDGKYYNLWNVDNEKTDENDDKVVKTVYDLSPVGYTVPPVRTFTGFTNTGNNSSVNNEFNVEGAFNKGWLFYCKTNKTGSTVFFHACGYRNGGTDSLTGLPMGGSCWVAGPVNTLYGRYLIFTSGNIFPLHNTNRSDGFAVRSAEEKKLKCGL